MSTNNNPKTAIRRMRCLCESVGPPDDSRLPWDYAALCSFCCKRTLRSHVERHEQALLERDIARERCAQRLAQVHSRSQSSLSSRDGGTYTNFSELQYESQRLRDRRAELQKQCAAMAVEVAALAVENEEHRESINPQAQIQREQLQRLEQSICQGSMKQAIENGRDQVKILRFQWALQAFAMHRLDVRPEDLLSDSNVDGSNTDPSGRGGVKGDPSSRQQGSRRRSHQERPKKARGIGKIGGLPLPHAGPELYGVLPPQELQSALRLVASITSTVARCLGILLPHPVLLQVSKSTQGDIIHSAAISSKRVQQQQQSVLQQQQRNTANPHHQSPTSTAALLSILETSLDGSKSHTPGSSPTKRQSSEERSGKTTIQPSMDAALVAQRLQHATAAVLAEADTGSSKTPPPKSSQYALSADNMNQEEFAIALQFLQNNVVALCIRAGVPVATLWPAEAVLLNLYALQVFCEDQVKGILSKEH